MRLGKASSIARLAVALAAIGFLASAFSPLPRAAQEDKLPGRAPIAEGEKLFARACSAAYCHGAGGLGGGAPRLRDKGHDAAHLFKVISEGVPGTGMRGYKADFSKEQIEHLVAFIMSDPTAAAAQQVAEPAAPSADSSSASAKSAVAASPSATATGDAQAGRALFFDSSRQKSCQSCHTFQGAGGEVGPDLSKLSSRSAREIFLAIIMPGQAKEPRYQTIELTLKDGERLSGVKKEEDEQAIRFYDVTALPAVLRTIQKSDIARADTLKQSPMPKDYAATLTLKQVLDIIAFLKSAGAQGEEVTLRELFER